MRITGRRGTRISTGSSIQLSRTHRQGGVMAFAAGKVDFTSPFFLQIPVLKDLKSQTSDAICELTPTNVNRNAMFNRGASPFNDPELLRAAPLSVDRKPFIDILTEGKGDIAGPLPPSPAGAVGLDAPRAAS